MTLEGLNLHFDLLDRLTRAKDTLAMLRQSALPGAAAMTGMPHAPGISDKVGSLAVEIADMDAAIQYLEKEVRANEEEITAFIQSIEDPQLRIIFRLRFIRGLTWKEVSQVMGPFTSERSVSTMVYKYLRAEEHDGEEKN